MSLTKRWLESQQDTKEKAIDDIKRDVRFALRIVGADCPLDWEDRTQAEYALNSALTSLELLKQEVNQSDYLEVA
jgi:hypothetical protein